MRNLNLTEIRICKHCNTPFSFNATPSKVNYGQGFFCSGLCQRRGRRQRKLEDSFFDRVGSKTKQGFILWKGNLTNKGYGCLGGPLAHRIAYELLVGPFPESAHVLHRCDNPPCINPVHLFLGTNNDNIDDKISKNRQAKGEAIGSSKLTEAMVISIRRRFSENESAQGELADEFKLSQSAVSKIVNRKLWKHIH